MGHWYNAFGESRYDAGLREARKLGLLPSVTTVDKIIANEGLQAWKENQVLEASLTLTRNEGERDKDFITRIKIDSKEQARKAARLGNIIHKLAERYIMGKPLFFHGKREDVWQMFEPLRNWIDENIMRPDFGFMSNEGAEVVIVNEVNGYAGKADFKGRHISGKKIILDFKSTFVKPSDIKKNGEIGKKKIYPSWGRQLAALSTTEPMILSVIVSTNIHCLGVWIYAWSEEELGKAWIEFKAALTIFRSVKNLEAL